jgi:hypothetical protein
MKKVLPILGFSLLLAGCSSSLPPMQSSVTDGNEKVITGEGFEITKNDVYHHIMQTYGSAQIFDIVLNYIADQEITDTELIEEKVNETVQRYVQQMENGIDDYAEQLGYESAEQYIDHMIRPNVKQELLKERYIEEHYETIVSEYMPRYLKIITVDTESTAMEIIDKSTSLDSFNTFLQDEDKTGQDVGIVTKESSTVDDNILDLLDVFTTDGVYSKAIKTEDNKFAVVYVYNTDTTDLEEQIKAHFKNVNAISTDYEIYYLNQYNFNVYEGRIKKEIENINEDYLG